MTATSLTPGSDAILERMMSMHPKVIDLTLDRTFELLAALGDPQRRVPPIIHLAGTNGKGSTQAMIRAGLEAAGKVAHAYTSPHLARFHERIRVAGQIISESDLTAILDECEKACQGRSITFFEVTTAAAFLAFARMPADYTLLEVGLGGEFDATNVFEKPLLSVITPISIDHQQYLGDTLPEIAGAKAGIIKRGVPCVVGPQDPAAMEVIEAKAARMGAPLIAHGQNWHIREEAGRLVFEDEAGLLDLPLPNLPGPHQIENAGAALAALRFLGLDEAACEAAVSCAFWPARMQRLRSGPLVAAARCAGVAGLARRRAQSSWRCGRGRDAREDGQAADLSDLRHAQYQRCARLYAAPRTPCGRALCRVYSGREKYAARCRDPRCGAGCGDQRRGGR
jgi:dihydrofolate synthase/folylpolyglutamate synthase